MAEAAQGRSPFGLCEWQRTLNRSVPISYRAVALSPLAASSRCPKALGLFSRTGGKRTPLHTGGMSLPVADMPGRANRGGPLSVAKADYLALRKARVPRITWALIGAAISAVSLAESLPISSD
jgi:hypothetical protein